MSHERKEIDSRRLQLKTDKVIEIYWGFSDDITKIQTSKFFIIPRFYFDS